MYLKGGTLFIKDFEDFDINTLTADNPKSPDVILSDELAECLFIDTNDSTNVKAYKQIAVACKYGADKIVVYPELRVLPESSDILVYTLKGLDSDHYTIQFESKGLNETNNIMYILRNN